MSEVLSALPAVNALLNSISAVLIVAGYIFIKQKKRDAHRKAMLSAIVTSGLFLVSYLIKTWFYGTTLYGGTGLARVIYLTILFSHLTLAIVVVPMAIYSVWSGLNNRLQQHRRIARWTYPLWLYVSVTGVIVYFMLRPWY